MLGDKYISVDMGTHTTKVIWAVKKGKKVSVLKHFAYKTPKGAISDGAIVSFEKVKAELQIQLGKQKIRCKKVLFSVGTSSTILRKVTLPVANKKELSALIRYELEKHVPIKLDEYLLDYEIVRRFKDEGINKIDVVAILIQKKIVDAYWELALSMRLKPIGLATHQNSIKSLYSGPTKSTAALIDIGHEHTICNIIKDGEFIAYKTIAIGGRSVALAIANVLNISTEEVEKRKLYSKQPKIIEKKESTDDKAVEDAIAALAKALNVSVDDIDKNTIYQSQSVVVKEDPRKLEKEQIKEAIEKTVENLATQIQRFLLFQEKSKVIKRTDKILLYGGCTYLDDIVANIKEFTGIQTELLDLNDSVVFSLSDNDKNQNLFHNTISIMKNIGR
ncbi:MAG: pilus assembly protein PilM [Alkaliphilus sp.]